MTFPHCNLEDKTIVHAFPLGCPLSYRDVNARQLAIRDRSYWDGKSDPHEANMMAAVDKCCSECVPRLLADAHIQHLRRKGPLNE